MMQGKREGNPTVTTGRAAARHWKRNRRLAMLALAAGAVMLPATRAMAQADFWQGDSGGNWTNTALWDSAQVPQAGDNVNINNPPAGSSQTVTYDYSGAAITLNYLEVGASSGGVNVLSIAQGTLKVDVGEVVGDPDSQGSQVGAINQSAGTNEIVGLSSPNISNLSVGNGGAGTYTFSGGTLKVDSGKELIGVFGTGNFNQSGGTNTVTGSVVVGGGGTGTGTYTMSNGALTVSQSESVVGVGVANFNQSGGTNTASLLYLQSKGNGASGPGGTYALSGGNLVMNTEYVGQSGSGFLNQTGGTNTLANSGGSLSVGDVAGDSGTYTLSQGVLNAFKPANEFVGNAGWGNFNQSGGTNTFRSNASTGPGGLTIGNTGTATGFYTLSGGSLLPGLNGVVVGNTGSGSFNHSGGTNSFSAGNLILGNFSLATGTYTLSGGVLSAFANEYIGNFGRGNFNQSGGTHTFTGQSDTVTIGNSNTASGSYTLSAGTLKVGSEFIGRSGRGDFNQSGGSNTVLSFMVFGENLTGTGTYTLSGGTLIGGTSETIAYGGLASFNQSGGTNTLTGGFSLNLGQGGPGTGTYTLSNGMLNVSAGTENVGQLGVGNFNQSGGTNTGSSFLYLAGSFSATGTYVLSGGNLDAQLESIGVSGLGNFNQSGGTNTLLGAAGGAGMIIGDSGTGTYKLSGGLLSAGARNVLVGNHGTFNQSGGTNSFGTGDLYLGNNSGATGTYILSSGALIANCVDGEIVGNGGVGNFNQTGGSNQLSTNLVLGQSASGTGTYTLTGGTLSVGGTTALGGPPAASGGASSMTVGGTGQFTTKALTIRDKGKLTLTGGSTIMTTLQMTGGILDVTTSSFTMTYGSGASPNASIRNYISSAYNVSGTPWSGTTGITSSAAAADKAHHSVAFADGSDTVALGSSQKVVTNLPGGITAYAPGGTLASGVEIVTYAYAGDANLDGKVDFADFIILSNHFGNADINWDHGNFNYDANIDFADFIVLSNDFGFGTGGGNGMSATPQELAQYNALAASFGISRSQIAAWDATISNLPEPASVGMLAIGAVALLSRRRRQFRLDL